MYSVTNRKQDRRRGKTFHATVVGKHAISANFALVKTDADLDGALALLQSGQIDVVETLPANLQQNLVNGKQSQVDFKYNEINPLNEQWIQYLAYAQVNEINRAVQLKALQQAQDEAAKRGVQAPIPPEVLVSPARPLKVNFGSRFATRIRPVICICVSASTERCRNLYSQLGRPET